MPRWARLLHWEGKCVEREEIGERRQRARRGHFGAQGVGVSGTILALGISALQKCVGY